MKYVREPIKVNVYIPASRRVRIYSPASFRKIFKYITLSRDEFAGYLKSLAAVAKAVEESGLEERVEFNVKTWMMWFWQPFMKGGFYSPAVMVDGKLISSGKIPDIDKVKEAVIEVDKRHEFLEDET